jgi:Nitrogen regulatory protein PII
MKKIEAIVEPDEFEELREQLMRAGLVGIRTSEIREYGTTAGPTITYRGATQTMKFLPKIKIELICTGTAVEIATAIISEQIRSARIREGKGFVSTDFEDVRMRTDEVSEVAL